MSQLFYKNSEKRSTFYLPMSETKVVSFLKDLTKESVFSGKPEPTSNQGTMNREKKLAKLRLLTPLSQLLNQSDQPNRLTFLKSTSFIPKTKRIQQACFYYIANPAPLEQKHHAWCDRKRFNHCRDLSIPLTIYSRLIDSAYKQNFTRYSNATLCRLSIANSQLESTVNEKVQSSFDLLDSHWVLNQLCQSLKSRSPRVVLNDCFQQVSKFSTVLGLRVTLSGRLGRSKKGMAQTLTRSVGRVPLSSFNQKVDYSQTCVHTKLGTIGVKVWLHHA